MFIDKASINQRCQFKKRKITEEQKNNLEQQAAKHKATHIFISAKNRVNTVELEELLVKTANLPSVTQNDVIVTNIRHYEALTHAQEAIHRVKEGLNNNISGDFLSQDIRECMHYLGEITGTISNDEILGNIFSHFCIGK
ncbi:hypothetical protein [uncultured Bacteroides sp.]|uniref:hypothetical protein n=1 Tax=uncultured Bacteroides sp. TaxID=162156 RepID=UPI00374A3E08